MSQVGSTERRGEAPRRHPGDRGESGGRDVQQAAPALAALAVSKRFGVVRALDDVTLAVRSGRSPRARGRKRRRQVDARSHLRRRLSARPGDARRGRRSANAPLARRRPCAWNPGHPSGAGHHSRSLDRGEPVPRRFSPHPWRLPRSRRSRASHPEPARRIRPRERPQPLDPRGRPQPGPASAHGDHARSSPGLESAGARRTDLFADGRRGAAPVPRGAAHERRWRRRSSTSPTGCGRFGDLADRIAVLRDGRLVDERPTAEFPEAEIVQAMVGRPISDLFERAARRRAADRPFGAGPDHSARPRCQFRCPLGRSRRPRGAHRRGPFGIGRGDIRLRSNACRLCRGGRPAGAVAEPGRRHRRRRRLCAGGSKVPGAAAAAQRQGQYFARNSRPHQPAELRQ